MLLGFMVVLQRKALQEGGGFTTMKRTLIIQFFQPLPKTIGRVMFPSEQNVLRINPITRKYTDLTSFLYPMHSKVSHNRISIEIHLSTDILKVLNSLISMVVRRASLGGDMGHILLRNIRCHALFFLTFFPSCTTMKSWMAYMYESPLYSHLAVNLHDMMLTNFFFCSA